MMSRKNAELAVRALRSSHTPQAVRQRLEGGPLHSYLKDFIYGAIDGTVTTFAVVSGVVGAELSSGVIIILGLANLLADGFSMAVSNFLGTSAEAQRRDRARAEELEHIQLLPDGEREEIRQILRRKGFSGEELEQAVNVITADISRWVDMMIQDEYGLALITPNPWKAALATFAAFLFVGLIPLAPFLWSWASAGALSSPFLWSMGATGLAFFCIGAAKSPYVTHSWYRAGLETLAIGAIASALAYGIGVLLKDIAVGG